jgi:hypothetical protein
MRSWLALVPAAIPVVALVGGLPFANRLEPVFFGMPFLLTWILAWVALTPAFLGVAYVILRRSEKAWGKEPALPGVASGDDSAEAR